MVPRFDGLAAPMQIDADDIVPIVYGAFLLRDALRTATESAWHPVPRIIAWCAARASGATRTVVVVMRR